MAQTLSTTDLARLAGEANTAHQRAGESIVSAIMHGLEAGRALLAAQDLVPYGRWGGWLAENFKGSDRSARRWMRLYRQRERLPGGDPLRTGASELSPSAALALLAAREEPERKTIRPPAPTEPMTPEQVARFHECEAVIRRGVVRSARCWRVLRRRIGAHPEGGEALTRVVAAARVGPPLPVSRPDLRLALDTWSERDLVRLLHANEHQPRLCGRILLAIESRGLFRPRFGTFEEWRADAGWDGEQMDEAIAWARASPSVPAELPNSEADCCVQAWRMLQMAEPDEAEGPEGGPADIPTAREKVAFNLLTTASMRIGAAAGWPWHECMELFARAADDLARVPGSAA